MFPLVKVWKWYTVYIKDRQTLKSKVREKWTERRETRKDSGKQPIKREREFYIANIKFP
jgi:hypothetical protein